MRKLSFFSFKLQLLQGLCLINDRKLTMGPESMESGRAGSRDFLHQELQLPTGTKLSPWLLRTKFRFVPQKVLVPWDMLYMLTEHLTSTLRIPYSH